MEVINWCKVYLNTEEQILHADQSLTTILTECFKIILQKLYLIFLNHNDSALYWTIWV